MKTKRALVFGIIMCALCLVLLLSACDLFGDSNYTIQYTDNDVLKTVTVARKRNYSIEEIPQKEGYEFEGLFDKESGGKQYVDSKGLSVAAFSDRKDITLYVRFKPKTYTFVLDYQGADVTDKRQVTATYDESLPALPTNVIKSHYKFEGWFTEENCQGVQIADATQLIPLVSVMNSDNFDINNESFTLYAGYSVQMLTVTLNFGSNGNEQISVEYGTDMKDISYETRVGGQGVTGWSKTDGGTLAFSGKITEDTTFYAIGYDCTIELDTNGGKPMSPLVAAEGSEIIMPVPYRENYKFMGWTDEDDNVVNITEMPTGGSLKAVWQAKLVFDVNGGTSVEDISEVVGSAIELPKPTKEGFVFAGWYTQAKEKYQSTEMPEESVVLKAGWYKEASQKRVLIKSDKSKNEYCYTSPATDTHCYYIDIRNLLGDEQSITVRIEGSVKLGTSYDGTLTAYVGYYSQKKTSSAYLICKRDYENITDTWRTVKFEETFEASDNIYMMWYTSKSLNGAFNYQYFQLSDYYYTIYYPDTSVLYL